jgi:hypothetical protein
MQVAGGELGKTVRTAGLLLRAALSPAPWSADLAHVGARRTLSVKNWQNIIIHNETVKQLALW